MRSWCLAIVTRPESSRIASSRAVSRASSCWPPNRRDERTARVSSAIATSSRNRCVFMRSSSLSFQSLISVGVDTLPRWDCVWPLLKRGEWKPHERVFIGIRFGWVTVWGPRHGRPMPADCVRGMRPLVGRLRWRIESARRKSGPSLRTLCCHREWIDERESVLQLALGFCEQSRALVGIELRTGE